MKKIKTIMVPIDFSDTSDILIEYAISFAKSFGAKLFVVHVVEDFSRYSSIAVPHISVDNIMKEVSKYAEKELDRYCGEKLEGKAEYEFMVLEGEAYKEILRLAEERDVDMILIGTHGASGLERVLFGSTAERVIRGAKCPITMVNTYRSK